MKNDLIVGRGIHIPLPIMQLLRRMLVLFFLFSVTPCMASFSQNTKLTFYVNNMSLIDIFTQIRNQGKYTFVYNVEDVKNIRVKSLNVKDASIENVLDICLEGTGLHYTIENSVVAIKSVCVQNKDPEKDKIICSGIVRDENGLPLPGVTVVLKNIFMGAVTDSEGKFKLELPKRDDLVLIFSFVGYKNQLIKVNPDKPIINVIMKLDVQNIDEVVVTGYQTIRKTEMVGSSNSVKREDLLFDGTNSLEQMLQGKLPGMVVMNISGLVGRRQKVRVRGTSTLLGNQEPVWVVDGIIQEDPLPFDTRNLDALGNISQDNFDMVKDFVGNAISWLNPNDIENITVLKDASATVMYGVKAANGVIMITTKKGQEGRLSVNYSGNVSVTPRLTYKKMNLMDSKQRVDVSREIYERGLVSDGRPLENIGYEGALKQYLSKEITYGEFNDRVKSMETMNTDWFDILFRNSVSMNHSVSISGGTDKVSYYGSINATVNKGTSIGNKSTNYSASVGLNAKMRDNVTLGLRLNGSTVETDGYYQVDPYGYAHSTNRVIPCMENGEPFFYKKSNGYNYNILNEIDKTGNTNTNRSLGVAATLRWEILKGLQFESSFGLNTSNVFGESYADEQSAYITQLRGYEFGTQRPIDDLYKRSQLPHGGELNTSENRNFNYTWRNMISYSCLLKVRHRFSIMFGEETRSNKYDGIASTVYGYFPERGKAVSMPPAMVQDSDGKMIKNDILDRYSTVVTDRKANYIGFFGTFTYGFDERYIFTASLRSDASNRFGQDTRNRFLPVWSLGGRWNVSREPWMQNQNIVSDLNFRASFGWQGNVAENYGPDLIARMGSGLETIDRGRTGEYMLFIKSLPYENLRWEKTKSLNLGTDFGMFQNRFTWTIEYYYKRTEDMIIQKSIPWEYGVAYMPINGGNMTNRGLEISLGFTPIRTKDFTWNVSLNTSKNFNKIESEIHENENWRSAAGGSLNKEGYAVSSFWAFDFTGLNPENGAPMFNIPSGEDNPGALTDATAYMKYMGTLEPNFSGGLSMSFRYKSLSLATSFNLNIGGKKFLYPVFDEDIVHSTPSAYVNLPEEMVHRWRKPGDENRTDIPSLPSKELASITLPNGATEYPHRLYNYSDARVVNASFLRCNSMSLNYTLPEKIVRKLLLKNLSLNTSVSNPFMIVSKEFKGMDPEVATGSQPISRTFSFGVNISL